MNHRLREKIEYTIQWYKDRMKKEGSDLFGYYAGITSALDWVLKQDDVEE